jgi:hypothetical protein
MKHFNFTNSRHTFDKVVSHQSRSVTPYVLLLSNKVALSVSMAWIGRALASAFTAIWEGHLLAEPSFHKVLASFYPPRSPEIREPFPVLRRF